LRSPNSTPTRTRCRSIERAARHSSQPRAAAQVTGENGEGPKASAGAAPRPLPLRYCSKLFSPLPVKHIGGVSLGPLLGALGSRLVVEIDHEQFERMKSRLVPRKASGPGRRKQRHPNSRSELVGNTEWAKIRNARRAVLLAPPERSSIA
jgi:hypothetical protein